MFLICVPVYVFRQQLHVLLLMALFKVFDLWSFDKCAPLRLALFSGLDRVAIQSILHSSAVRGTTEVPTSRLSEYWCAVENDSQTTAPFLCRTITFTLTAPFLSSTINFMLAKPNEGSMTSTAFETIKPLSFDDDYVPRRPSLFVHVAQASGQKSVPLVISDDGRKLVPWEIPRARAPPATPQKPSTPAVVHAARRELPSSPTIIPEYEPPPPEPAQKPAGRPPAWRPEPPPKSPRTVYSTYQRRPRKHSDTPPAGGGGGGGGGGDGGRSSGGFDFFGDRRRLVVSAAWRGGRERPPPPGGVSECVRGRRWEVE